MNKRDFLKTSLFGAIGLLSLSAYGKTTKGNLKPGKIFKLPDLPYSYNSLEPFIDEETMKMHHLVHHAAFADRLNSALQEQKINVASLREIFYNSSKFHSDIQVNSSGYFNHRIFFRMLSPKGGGLATGKIAGAINKEFGSFENFKTEFSTAALNQIGSGWTWLINQNGSLKIINTDNNENPLMDILSSEKRGFPLLCIDVWDHAYCIKYQNNKEEYIQSFWKIVNWETINKRFYKSIS
jgi:superoxide dismutase, Fe-Mn family